ncbi:uncharacterized protein G2W53_019001 [Senna tora]|uniref:Uncharacterized protein n=1 Tax=Senna tora TaxID=362788 RepID=A0A834TTF6_9FABA|nr:uncharacterized protein G2W53_019001 [Senna tora]
MAVRAWAEEGRSSKNDVVVSVGGEEENPPTEKWLRD